MDNEDWVTGKVGLRIGGEPVEMEMTVPARPVKPQRMLPIFQQMSSAVVDMSVSASEAAGKEISCKAGCGACCRQAVPISEVEAYQIAALVEEMPELRRSEIKRRFDAALLHFIRLNWFEELVDLQDMSYVNVPGFSPEKYSQVVMKYFNQNIACPFLENESCSIHPDRPLSCREYLVTSSPEFCKAPNERDIKKVPVFLRPSKALLKVGKTKNTAGISSLMLIEALNFAQRNPDIFEERTGERWAAAFFEELTKTDIPLSAGEETKTEA